MLGVKPSKLPRQLWSSAHCSKSCSSKDDFFLYASVAYLWNDFIIQNLSSSSWDDKTNSMVGSVSSIGLCAIKTDWDVYHNVLFPCTDPFFYQFQLPSCFSSVQPGQPQNELEARHPYDCASYLCSRKKPYSIFHKTWKHLLCQFPFHWQHKPLCD